MFRLLSEKWRGVVQAACRKQCPLGGLSCEKCPHAHAAAIIATTQSRYDRKDSQRRPADRLKPSTQATDRVLLPKLRVELQRLGPERSRIGRVPALHRQRAEVGVRHRQA